MSFQFQLHTQLDSIHKNVKQEDIDREKIRKWVLRVLKESPELSEKKLDELYDLYHKFFNEVLEVINEFKNLETSELIQEKETAFGSAIAFKTLTSKEASDIAGVSEKTIYRWAKEGKIDKAPNKRIILASLLTYIGKKS